MATSYEEAAVKATGRRAVASRSFERTFRLGTATQADRGFFECTTTSGEEVVSQILWVIQRLRKVSGAP
jgi:hypothetical protein